MDILTNFEGQILIFIQEYIRQDWMDGFWKFVTSLGNGGRIWILLAVIMLFFGRSRMSGITATVSMIIGLLITNLTLKNLFARIRPYEVFNDLQLIVEKESEFSFPSGHACASFAAAFVFYKMLPGKIGIPAMILALLIAVSRLYVGVHYPTDVIFGILCGMLSAVLAMKLTAYIQKKREQKKAKTTI